MWSGGQKLLVQGQQLSLGAAGPGHPGQSGGCVCLSDMQATLREHMSVLCLSSVRPR